MSHNPPARFSITPAYVGDPLFITYTVPPVHVTNPALVNPFCTYFAPPPLNVSAPSLAIVTGPSAVPPLQATNPPAVTFRPLVMVPPLQFNTPPLVTNKLPDTPLRV